MKKLPIIVVAVIVIVVLAALMYASLKNNGASTNSTVTYGYTIVNTYPHDTSAFTEGLVYSDGYLYESSGSGNGAASTLRQVDLTTGKVVQEYTLPAQYFGEGIAVVNDTILQLTWQSNIGFIYDKNTFALLGNFTYPTQGWGLTYDGKELIMSDGSDHLYFLNATTFQPIGEVEVHEGNATVPELNSLCYINGSVYANVWMTNKIVIINPETGQVTGSINLTGLPAAVASLSNNNAVLNGIAYDSQNSRLFVTGKDWQSLYQIKLVP